MLNSDQKHNEVNVRNPISKLLHGKLRDIGSARELLLGRYGVYFNPVAVLQASVAQGYLETIDWLLSNVVNVNAVSIGWKVLMSAARHGHANVVKMLLISGAKIQPELQGNAVVEVAIKSIAEERADHRLVCHVITQSLTAEKDSYMTPADSKDFNLNLMSMLPTNIAREIATMSASGDMPYDVASRISNEVVNDQKEEARAADAGIDNENQQSQHLSR